MIPTPASPGPVWGVLLAAGRGTRFGGDKLLQDLDGSPLIQRPLDLLARAITEGLLAGGVVVTAPGDSPVAALARAVSLHPVANPDAPEGIASSVRTAVAALGSTDAAAALFLLGDEPFVPLAVIEAVLDSWRRSGAPMIRAQSGNAPRHPVLVARALWDRAAELRGDAGFRALSGIAPVTVPGDLPHHDVDTRDDLAVARAAAARKGIRDA